MATGLTVPDAPPRPATPTPPSVRRRRPLRHPVGTTVLAAIAFVLLFAIVWIGVRGYLAQRALNDAVPSAETVKTAIGSGDIPAAARAADALHRRTADAAALTSDPIWVTAEAVPWIGPNLTAVREAAAASDAIAAKVVQPLVAAGGAVDLRALAMTNGRIDLDPIIKAQPAVAKAAVAFSAARASVASIETGALVSPVAGGIDRLHDVLDRAAPDVEALNNTVRLLPSMLGAAGPRDYLLVAQNPAELRSTGGLIGAVALVHADKGAVSLQRQSAGTAIGPWETPVADVPLSTQGLYGPLVGRYLQDVNLTPHFPLAAATAARMWTTTYGGTVDGVVAVDPVVLSGLLSATGPVTLPTGDRLTSDNAVKLLLSDVYQRYSDPAQQDGFFASAASAVFARLSGGGVDGKKLVTALAAAGESRRVLIWSEHGSDQKILGRTTLAGGLPRSDLSAAGIGVYFNDATGSKMDYYLGTSVAAGAAVCRADGKPSTMVSVTLTNRAPADAGTSLPKYVTGGGSYGVTPGNIRTRVAVYGPAGGFLAATQSDGTNYATVAGVDATRPVSLFTVELAPGESRTVSVQFLNAGQTAANLDVVTTPTLPGDGTTPVLGARNAVRPIVVQCASVVK
ncbi:DUF4012 domain-containing protein [Leifsonia shinshuensis]|uniref:DUF4012 domain-containing protein n=1 Tax=Leifsonia shinshuensis TaxID=150026 RepID=UPI0028640D3B|nr:DUF4012 domain-containing protein [Leifsonia shinshuensis]MDR6973138.1 hypothetical protein [Leifsonia shinshuensis]